MLSCPYFVKKFVNSVKDYTILWTKNTLLSCPYLVQKTSFCQNCNTILTKKSQKDAYFLLFRFLRKKSLLSCSFFVNKRQFSKKNTALMPIFCQKTSISWKPSANMSFFSIFLWKTTCSFPYLLKNVNSVKTTQYYGPKNSIGYHFFWYFKKETQLQSQICQKKCPLS